MRNVGAIFRKEMRSYFGSPIAYVVAAVYLLFMGFMFRNLVLDFNQLSMTYLQRQMAPRVNVHAFVLNNFFGVQFFVWMIMTPMLTMRLLAEEKRSGTMELLMTSPLTVWQVLIGKFTASLSLYLLIEVCAFALLGILRVYTDLDWGPVFSAGLAVLLMGSAFISVGILASSVTENQVIAVLLSFFILILLWVIDLASRFAGPLVAEILKYLSYLRHMQDMTRGVIDTGDILFFLSMSGFFMFLAYTVLESRRWRQ